MACWQNSPTCERTSPLRFWRTIICEMRALLSPSVSIIERAGSGSRCASVLTFTGTGDGGGAPPPLIAASAAFSMTCTSPTQGDRVVDRRLAAAFRRASRSGAGR